MRVVGRPDLIFLDLCLLLSCGAFVGYDEIYRLVGVLFAVDKILPFLDLSSMCGCLFHSPLLEHLLSSRGRVGFGCWEVFGGRFAVLGVGLFFWVWWFGCFGVRLGCVWGGLGCV